MHDSSCVFEIIQQAQMASNSLSVKELCQIAGVSRSGYYAWLKAAPAVSGLQRTVLRSKTDAMRSERTDL